MGKTDYAGIDYGLGMANVDNETGIRYGVISQHSVSQIWNYNAEADYGDPHCPECGNEPSNDLPDDDEENRGYEFYCSRCEKGFDSDSAYPDEPIGWNYDQEGYKLTDCLDSDIMILKSPFYTFAQFCSPCVPGAGNLDSPCDSGPKTYCLGHDWFEEEEAPYPVFSVETGKRVVVIRQEVQCPNCGGSGLDTLDRIAEARGCNIKDIDTTNFAEFNIMTGEFKCFRCDGKGTVTERHEEEE